MHRLSAASDGVEPYGLSDCSRLQPGRGFRCVRAGRHLVPLEVAGPTGRSAAPSCSNRQAGFCRVLVYLLGGIAIKTTHLKASV